jgi:hypothetical protein
MLADYELKVLSPGIYTCDIHKLDYSTFKPIFTHNRGYVEHSYAEYGDKIMYTNQMYLASNLLTDESYWATLNIGNSGIYFKLICKINSKNGHYSETLYEPRCIIIYEYNCNGYAIYKTSLPLSRIPSTYKIVSTGRKEWNELCDMVIKNDIHAPISSIINVSDLRRFINEFF